MELLIHVKLVPNGLNYQFSTIIRVHVILAKISLVAVNSKRIAGRLKTTQTSNYQRKIQKLGELKLPEYAA